MQVHIEGIEKLNERLTKLGPEVLRAADRGLKSAGMHIIADAQENLRRDNINATGTLSQSGKVQRSTEVGGGYDVGFMSAKSYAGAVEYGRRAGKMPPVADLVTWVRKKHKSALASASAFSKTSQKSLAEQAATKIAWHIKWHGTKPHPFFAPAVKKNQGRVLAAVRDAVLPIINRNGNV